LGKGIHIIPHARSSAPLCIQLFFQFVPERNAYESECCSRTHVEIDVTECKRFTLPDALPIRRFINRGVLDDEPKVLECANGRRMRGMKMRLSPRRRADFTWVRMNPERQQSWVPFIQPGLTVFDVGANIGFFAIATGNVVGATGKSWPLNRIQMFAYGAKKNLELNGLGSAS
jgi:hypothetical protein